MIDRPLTVVTGGHDLMGEPGQGLCSHLLPNQWLTNGEMIQLVCHKAFTASHYKQSGPWKQHACYWYAGKSRRGTFVEFLVLSSSGYTWMLRSKMYPWKVL